MNDRIKLAEAMGWHGVNDKYLDRDTNLYVLAGFPPNVRAYSVRSILPDPFTDANDDYAVLEWARTNPKGFGVCHDGRWMGWTAFMHMNEQEAHQYKIGDYARAALKVIE